MTDLFSAYLVISALMSTAAFACFGIDKLKAKLGAWRISESALLTLTFLCGAFGALAGMLIFHHKTKKIKFIICVPLALILWSAAGVLILLKGMN